MAPRVTRAAARADPVLADETQQLVDDALAQAAAIPSTESPAKQSRRAALGAISGNDTLTSAQNPVEVDLTTPDENADIILHVGLEKPAKSEAVGTPSPKKSMKKVKGTASRRTPRHQRLASTESATEDAASRGLPIPLNLVLNSPARPLSAAHVALSDISSSVPGTQKFALAVAPAIALGTDARVTEGEKKSEVVQKLCSLFEPPSRAEEIALTSPLAISTASPIDVIDAFETEMEAVEAAEASLQEMKAPKDNDTENKQRSEEAETRLKSQTQAAKRKTNTQTLVFRTKEQAPRSLSTEKRKSTIESSPAKPVSARRTRPRSEIVALNTPPRVTKSTKPATVPSFELPGEAVARKHKAAKEEREKRREEEALKKKEELRHAKQTGTIRPMSKSSRVSHPGVKSVGELRTTKALPLTRSSSPLKHEIPAGVAADSSPERTTLIGGTSAVPRVAKLSTAASMARTSRLQKPAGGTVKHSRPSIFDAAPRESPRPVVKANTARARVPPGTAAIKASPTVKGIAVRERLAKVEQERLVQERVDAARRIKEEATQRGRAAAVAWAEKQQKQQPKKVAPLAASAAA